MDRKKPFKQNLETPGAKITLILSIIFAIKFVVDLIAFIVAIAIEQSNIFFDYYLYSTSDSFFKYVYLLSKTNIINIIIFLPGIVAPLTFKMSKMLSLSNKFSLFIAIVDLLLFIMFWVSGFKFDIQFLIFGIAHIAFFFTSGLLHTELEYNY